MKQRNKAPDVIKDTVDSGDKLEKPAQVDTGVRYRYRDTGVRYRWRDTGVKYRYRDTGVSYR